MSMKKKSKKSTRRKKRTRPDGTRCPNGEEYSDQFQSCLVRKDMKDMKLLAWDEAMWIQNKGKKSGIFGTFKVRPGEGKYGTELDISTIDKAIIFAGGKRIEATHLEVLIPNEAGRKKHLKRK